MRETRCNFVCCNFGAGDLWWQVQSRRGDVRSVWEDGMHVPELAGSVRIDRLARFGGQCYGHRQGAGPGSGWLQVGQGTGNGTGIRPARQERKAARIGWSSFSAASSSYCHALRMPAASDILSQIEGCGTQHRSIDSSRHLFTFRPVGGRREPSAPSFKESLAARCQLSRGNLPA